MFARAKFFNGDLSKWDVSHVIDTSGMFWEASAFNGDLSKWDVSSVTEMQFMFRDARVFNRDISKWDVSSVKNMYGMFQSASAFNGDISKWDVFTVKNMHAMFHGASVFNSDITEWDVSSVTIMDEMFRGAHAFNRDLSKWDVSRVTNMDAMFWEAFSFKQILCGPAWMRSTASQTNMFTGSPGSLPWKVCVSSSTTKYRHLTRRPLPEGRDYFERDLKIVRAPITTKPVSTNTRAMASNNKMVCLKCGTFKKSGRVSCCAPGGAWYKNCGGAANGNADHRWFEGLEACKCK
jgi:surface protein